MQRRANNEGSEPLLRKDGRYASNIRLPDGHRQTIYGKTKTECRANVRTFMSDLENGITRIPGNTTVNQWLNQWLNEYCTDLRPATVESYRLQIDRYIIPAIGSVRLNRLTSDHAQTLRNQLATTDLSGTSQQYIFRVLSSALNRAVRTHKLRENPIKYIDLPRKTTEPVTVWDAKATATFLARVAGDRHEALFTLAALCGLRQGEILGLRWSDINWTEGTLTVAQQLNRTGAIGPLKTRQSRRTIVMPNLVVALLKTRRTAQTAEIPATGNTLDLVFTTRTGLPIRHTNLTHTFYRRTEKAGLPAIPFHGLRHVAATLQFALGARLEEVSDLLGHKDDSTTTRLYTHLLPAGRTATAERVNQIFPARKKKP